VFIPFTLPSETINAQIAGTKGDATAIDGLCRTAFRRSAGILGCAAVASKIGTIVMLSCNPVTLAREAAVLVAGRFTLRALGLRPTQILAAC
jgi:tRNA/tmRNA/rRNA uracil-C5-methylase (TrmA/RlmC/RlmD family)